MLKAKQKKRLGKPETRINSVIPFICIRCVHVLECIHEPGEPYFCVTYLQLTRMCVR